MAQILIITSGISSIVNANLEMARKLQHAGHHVTYASKSNIQEIIERQNLNFQKLGVDSTADREDKANTNSSSLTDKTQQQRLIEEKGWHQFSAQISATRPDLIIIDIELHECIFSALSTGTPVLLVSTFLSLWKCPGLPPLHLNSIPGTGLSGSAAGISLSWFYFRLRKFISRTRHRLKEDNAAYISLLKHHAKQCNVDFNNVIAFNQWLIPFFYRSIPVINLNTKEFDFPHSPPSQCHFAGPQVCLDRREQYESDSEEKKIWDRLYTNLVENPDRNKKLIYCAFGQFNISYQKKFLQKIIDVFKARPEWQLVMSLGGQFSREELNIHSDNVAIFDWIPQLKILPMADCALIHAGISSINECIHFSVPMLTYSIGIRDQNGNAARAGYHHLGIVGNRQKDSCQQIGDYIETLLFSHEIRKGLEKMKHHTLKYTEQDSLNNVITHYLQNNE